MSKVFPISDDSKPPAYSEGIGSTANLPSSQIQIGFISSSTPTASPFNPHSASVGLPECAIQPCPPHPVARLMFYVHLVMRGLELNAENGGGLSLGVRRLIDYQNHHLLSAHELSALLRIAQLLSPLRLEGSVIQIDNSIPDDEGFRLVSRPIVGLNLIGLEEFSVRRSVFSVQTSLHYKMHWLVQHFYEPQEHLKSHGIQGISSAPLSTAPSLYTSQTSARRSRDLYCVFTSLMLALIVLGFAVIMINLVVVFLLPAWSGGFLRFVPFIVAIGLFFTGAILGIITRILYRNNRYS